MCLFFCFVLFLCVLSRIFFNTAQRSPKVGKNVDKSLPHHSCCSLLVSSAKCYSFCTECLKCFTGCLLLLWASLQGFRTRSVLVNTNQGLFFYPKYLHHGSHELLLAYILLQRRVHATPCNLLHSSSSHTRMPILPIERVIKIVTLRW